MKVAVIYWSGTGNTSVMASSLAEDLKEKGAEVTLLNVSESSPSDAGGFDGYALGCPAMGAEQLEDGEFEPYYETIKADLNGKKVVLFGSYGWGGGVWMDDWKQDADNSGANVVATVVCENAPDDNTYTELKDAANLLA